MLSALELMHTDSWRLDDMPKGKGTYGKKRGRPPKKKKYKRKTIDVWEKTMSVGHIDAKGRRRKAKVIGFFRTERAARKDDALMWGDNKKNSKVRKRRKPLNFKF